MPADGNLTNLSLERARRAGAPTLTVVEQSPAGSHGYPEPEALAVDQDGNRVLIRGVWARTFMDASNATRSAAALQVLADLGWPIERLIEPPTPPQAA